MATVSEHLLKLGIALDGARLQAVLATIQQALERAAEAAQPLKDRLGELRTAIGAKLAPAFGHLLSRAQAGFSDLGARLKTEFENWRVSLTQLPDAVSMVGKALKAFLGPLGKELKEAMEPAQKAWKELALNVGKGGLKDAIAEVATDLARLVSSGDATAGTLGKTLGDAVRGLWRGLKEVGGKAREMLDAFGGLGAVKPLLLGVGFAIAAIKVGGAVQAVLKFAAALATTGVSALMAQLPLFVLGALILAAGFLIQDLWRYFNGGDSAIGALVQRFPAFRIVLDGVKRLIDGFAPTFGEIRDAAMTAWEQLQGGLEVLMPILTAVFGFLLQVVGSFFLFSFQRFLNLFTFVGQIVGAIFGLFANLFSGVNPFDALRIFAEQTLDAVRTLFQNTIGNIIQLMRGLAGAVGIDLHQLAKGAQNVALRSGPSPSPAAPGGWGNFAPSTVITNNVTVPQSYGPAGVTQAVGVVTDRSVNAAVDRVTQQRGTPVR